jgi:hypothetical protein
MYLVLKDLKLSGLVPGKQHIDQVYIEKDEPVIRTRICRAGYAIIKTSDTQVPGINLRDWHKMPRIK